MSLKLLCTPNYYAHSMILLKSEMHAQRDVTQIIVQAQRDLTLIIVHA